jgi:hypothetical protein
MGRSAHNAKIMPADVARWIVTLSDLFRPLLPLFATLLGALVAWAAVHRVSRNNAKREAYASYVGAAEIYASDLYRFLADKNEFGTAEPVVSGPVTEPLGAILLVAPPDVVTLVQGAQAALSDLSRAVNGRGDFIGATRNWNGARGRLIQSMREDSGSDRLPGEFFARA